MNGCISSVSPCLHNYREPRLVRTYLSPRHERLGVRLDEVVGAPLDGLQRVPPLPGGLDVGGEVDGAPREHGDGEGHGQAELDVVAGVVVPADEFHPLLQPVGEARVAPPQHELVVRQPPRPLRLEVEQAVGQRRAVVRRLAAAAFLDGLRRRGAVAPAVVEDERQQQEEPHRRGGAGTPAHGQRQARARSHRVPFSAAPVSNWLAPRSGG
jgi:hypothetical protein